MYIKSLGLYFVLAFSASTALAAPSANTGDLDTIAAPAAANHAPTEFKKRQIPFVPCSAQAWLEDCTGWPSEAAFQTRAVKRNGRAKRSEKAKRSAEKRSEVKKRQGANIPFIPCSAQAWIDDCTGWP